MQLINITKLLQKEEIRYIGVGVFNTLNQLFWYSIFSTLIISLNVGISVPVSLVISNIFASIISVSVGFLLACYITFKVKPTWKKFFEFPIIHVVNLLLSSGLIYIYVDFFLLDKTVAQVLTWPIVIPISFILSRMILKR